MGADNTLCVAWGWGLVGGHWGRLPGGGDGKDACGRRWDLEFPRCPPFPWPPQHLSFFTPGIYSTNTIKLLDSGISGVT